MSEFIHKKHNVSVLMYHIVCPTRYRRAVFAAEVDAKVKEVCAEIQKRYEITFLEIGTDDNHVHFLVQSVPMYSPKQIVQIIKSITAREIFKSCPKVKQYLWGGKFWAEGYARLNSRRARQRTNDKELRSATRQFRRKWATSALLIPRQLAAG